MVRVAKASPRINRMTTPETVTIADSLRSFDGVLVPDPRADGQQSLAQQRELIAAFELTLLAPLDIRVHFETAKNLYLYAWFVFRFYPVAEQQALSTLEFGLRARLAMSNPDLYGPDSNWIPGLSKMLEAARKDGLISNAGMRATERWAMQRARGRVSNEATRRLIESGAEFIEFDLDNAVPEPQDYSDDALSIFIETLPAIRNTYAHGSSMLHSTVLGTFEIVTDLVNQLFPVDVSAMRPSV
jgi:hypothetical protein